MSQTRKRQIFGQIRTLFALISGMLISHGWLDEGVAQEITAIALVVVSIVWSWMDKEVEVNTAPVPDAPVPDPNKDRHDGLHDHDGDY